jgi:DNA polymerase alpha subunit A
VSDPKDINPVKDTEAPQELPPLTVLSLAVRTIVNHRENKQEVICATARIWHNSKQLPPLVNVIS